MGGEDSKNGRVTRTVRLKCHLDVFILRSVYVVASFDDIDMLFRKSIFYADYMRNKDGFFI